MAFEKCRLSLRESSVLSRSERPQRRSIAERKRLLFPDGSETASGGPLIRRTNVLSFWQAGPHCEAARRVSDFVWEMESPLRQWLS